MLTDEKIVITDEFRQWFEAEWLRYEDKKFTCRVKSMTWALKAWRYLKRCEYCDGTGDVHSIDGEWRGECTACDANKERT